MIEVSQVRQIPGEPRRRWFSSARFDLFVYCDEAAGFTGFQLCYDKPRSEQAIVYNEAAGLRPMRVDDGEQRPGRYKATPMLVTESGFDAARIYLLFCQASEGLPIDVANYVRQALERHPEVRAGVRDNA